MKIFRLIAFGVFYHLLTVSAFGTSEAIRIGINPWPGYDYLRLAEVKQFFAHHEASVKLINFASLSDTINAFQRGQLDGVATTIADAYFLTKRISDRPVQILMVVDHSAGADVIIGSPGLKNACSLKGKKIGLELQSLGTYVLYRSLSQCHLTLKDVLLVPLTQLEMSSALKQKKVDAVVTYPPYSIESLKIKKTKTLFSSKEIPGEILDVILLKKDLLKNRPKDAQGIIQAFYEALAYRESHKDEADQIMSQHEGVSVDEFRSSLEEIQVIGPEEFIKFFRNGASLKNTLEEVEKALATPGNPNPFWNVNDLLEPIFQYQARQK